MSQPPPTSETLKKQAEKPYVPDGMGTDENGNWCFRVDKDGVPFYLKSPHTKSGHPPLVVRKFIKHPGEILSLASVQLGARVN